MSHALGVPYEEVITRANLFVEFVTLLERHDDNKKTVIINEQLEIPVRRR